jgi:hypothetical protein
VCLTFSSECHFSVKVRLDVQRNSEILQKYLLNGISKKCFLVFSVRSIVQGVSGGFIGSCFCCSALLPKVKYYILFSKPAGRNENCSENLFNWSYGPSGSNFIRFLAKQRNNLSLFHVLGGVVFFYSLSLKWMTHHTRYLYLIFLRHLWQWPLNTANIFTSFI